MNHQATIAKQYLMPITARPDIVFSHGKGAYLYDQTGKSYLDWVQGWAVNSLGHCPDQVVDALTRQARTLINPSPAFYNTPALELAAFLTQHSCFDEVFFASSGAEANEGAIKLARKWGQRYKYGAAEIITFQNGFHGRTLATMAASGKAGWDQLFAPGTPGFKKAVFNNLDSVAQLISPDTVAVMLEPIQGEAGVIPADPAFMQGLQQLCAQNQLLLIVDEVQTGCARTGHLFAYQHYGIEPDIMTLGKGIGGGVPLSALLAKTSVSCFEAGDQGGTYCGNPLMCAVGLAVMQHLARPEFLLHIQEMSGQLAQGLAQLSHKYHHGKTRGLGLLLALELSAPIGPALVECSREHGLLINAPRPNCLRLMPALNSTSSQIEEGLAQLDSVFAQLQ